MKKLFRRVFLISLSLLPFEGIAFAASTANTIEIGTTLSDVMCDSGIIHEDV